MRLTKIGRRILTGIAIVIMLLGAAFMYLDNRNRTLSPPGSAEITNGTLTIAVDYSRPSVKGRLVFGLAKDGAIQPWGQYWRLGANEPTSMTLNTDVSFNGDFLKAGTYQLYAVPNETSFKIGVNSADRVWGYSEPDYSLDVLTTEVSVLPNRHTEQHTISLKEQGNNGVIMIIEFSNVKLEIPISAN